MTNFVTSHPLRIDIDGETHVRFKDLFCAARTAVDRKLPVWDESTQKGYSVADCKRLVESRSGYGTHSRTA